MTRPSPWRFAGAALLIAAATLVVYGPALSAGFIWDDAAHLTAPRLRSWEGLRLIWTEPGATQQYYPILHSAFWLQHRLWADHAFAYHAVNLALHATAAGLAGLLLWRLALPGALIAALIFAVHPVHVESVAWISEQKNTLSAVFYLAAALAYLSFDTTRRRSTYLLATVLFVLALLTKTVTATLPAALLLVFWWQRGRLDARRDVLPLAPWFVVGVAAGLFTAWVERRLIGAEGVAFDLTWPQRALLAGRVVWFYLGKLAWPQNLTFFYPRWEIASASLRQWLPLGAALVTTLLLWRQRTRTRGPLAAWLFFGGTLLPVLGFFNVYPFMYSYVADHFQYLASLGLIALAAAGLLAPSLPAARLRAAVAGFVVLVLAVVARQQTHDYHDAETLFRATVARNPAAWVAHNNLGELLMKEPSRRPEAIACFDRALALRPDYFEAHNNLGLALTQVGRPQDALPHLRTAVGLKPAAHQAHNNLGIALASSGDPTQALHSFATAATLNPTVPNIQENWAKALLLLGRREEAAEHFAIAARLRAAR